MRKRFSLLLLLLSVLFTSCGIQKENKIDLTQNWEYTLQNGLDSNAVYTPLKNELIGNLHTLVPENKGTIWLKSTFRIPQNLKIKDISCYLGRITIADRTYFNGVLIGTEGKFPPREFTAWNTTRLYEIPENIVNNDGENTLIVEIYVNGEGSIVSGPYIGLSEDTRISAGIERFWNSQINALIAFTMFIIAIYHLMVWIKNKKEKEALYFALINIISVLYMSVFYLPELPGYTNHILPFLWFQKIFSSAMPFALPFLMNSFINAFLKRKENKVILIFRILFMVIPVAVIFAAPDYVHLRNWRIYYQSFLIPPIAYIVLIIAIACFKKQKYAGSVLWGFSPFLFTVVLDVAVHDWMHWFNLPYISSIGWQLVIIALLFVLANKFSNARKEAEYLNIHLKDEVEERTKDLSESNSRLTEANDELTIARKHMEDDMRLAAYVQQSFFPRFTPATDDWDVAFTFKPASGVSGDLYDFFSEGRKLTGISLFDVSGHGIAAGLVTMLAKNVISRKFTSDKNVKLGTIMNEINSTIVNEKGNVENYMTGVLIRLDDGKVQLINAGHPSIFLRNAKTGKCVPVKITGEKADKLANCGLVGIADLQVDFKAIQFTMEKDDALILYTDCLCESKNANNEEYSQERICEIFSKSGNDRAQSKLDYVLNDFNRFTEGTTIKDDLTVIVLQKK